MQLRLEGNAVEAQRVERRMAAILAADVAGYSRLMGADEEGTLARLKAHRRELIDPKIKEHHGRIFKTTGDGVLVEFPSVVEAVRCAVEVQRGMVDRNAAVPQDKRIEFRIGVNLGDIIVDPDDIHGDGVNVAARLQGLAEPGGVCISRTVRDQVRDKLPYQFEDLGEQTVKNIARPVKVFGLAAKAVAALPEITAAPLVRSSRRPSLWIYAAAIVIVIAAISVGVWRTGLAPAPQATGSNASIPATPRLSIVALPFVNLSNDPDQEYFADGFTDILTTDLSRIPGSFVIARNTAYTYKGKAVDAKQVGRELGVRYIVEGSVQRSNNQIRVNTQLIDGETGSHLWAESFDRDRGDLFAIEDEITKRIAYALDMQLTNIEAQRAEQRSTSPDAVDYVMRGDALGNRPVSKDNLRAMAELYERALQLDEHLPAALTGLADVLSERVLDEWSDAREDDLRRAEDLVSRALAVAPNYFHAHHVKGQILRAQRRYDEAIVEYETVIALWPMAVSARSHLARAKIFIGEPAEAIPLLEQAMRISPRDPSIGFMYYRLGFANLLLGNPDEAIRWDEKAVLTYYDPRDPYRDLAAAWGLKGDKAAAQAALAECAKQPTFNYATLAEVRRRRLSDRPKFVALLERTVIEGLRKAGMPEE
jgi:adenylate cyclase